MATNKVQDGKVIQGYQATGSTIASGQPVILGSFIVGFALEDIATASTGSVEIGGVWSYPVKGHNGTTNAAVAQYAKVYYTAGDAFFDVDSSETLAGIALSAVSSGSTTTIDVMMLMPPNA